MNSIAADILYSQGDGESLHLDIYVPSGTGPFPIGVVLHGGGWGSGDKKGDIKTLCEALMESGFVCVAPSYRLAPKYRWPACLQDVYAALKWTNSHIAQFKGDSQRIALLGYSAGGHLACLAAMQSDANIESDAAIKSGVDIKAVVALAAPTDLVADSRHRGEVSPALRDLMGIATSELTPAIERQLAELSPLNFVRAGRPPHLLLHGTADQSVPFAQSLAFGDKLRAVGVPCDLRVMEGAPHRLATWGEFAPHYAEEIILWLHQILLPPASLHQPFLPKPHCTTFRPQTRHDLVLHSLR